MTELLRQAATAVLVRDSDSGLQVLLLQRNAASKFASSAWVFPGGGFEPCDVGDTETLAAKQCAVRETHEECGLVLVPDSLHYFAHWTTPEGTPKRYATWFFVAQCEPNLTAKADGHEIIAASWLAPAEALERHANGEMVMMPPTVTCLELLKRFDNANSAKQHLQSIKVKPILPHACSVDGGVCMLYPGDAGYQSSDVSASGDRHRFWIVKSGWRYESNVDWFGLDHLL